MHSSKFQIIYTLFDRFKQFDNTYIRPCLIRDLKGAEPKILETFSKLTMRDAMDMMSRNPNNMNGNMPGNKFPEQSMAALIRSANLPGV